MEKEMGKEKNTSKELTAEELIQANGGATYAAIHYCKKCRKETPCLMYSPDKGICSVCATPIN